MNKINFKIIKIGVIFTLVIISSFAFAEVTEQVEQAPVQLVSEYANIYNDDGTVMERVLVSIQNLKIW